MGGFKLSAIFDLEIPTPLKKALGKNWELNTR